MRKSGGNTRRGPNDKLESKGYTTPTLGKPGRDCRISQGQRLRGEQKIPREREPRVVMVDRNQNTNEVVQQFLHDNMVADINLAGLVERIMA